MAKTKSRKRHWLHEHSLSIVSILLLLAWIIGYSLAALRHRASALSLETRSRIGAVPSFIILGTKFLYEIGSAESRPIKNRKSNRWLELLYEHSLLIFLAVTGIGWLVLYLRMNPEDKWGQVVGNIVSEWLQMAGLVFLTKRLIERGSKESR